MDTHTLRLLETDGRDHFELRIPRLDGRIELREPLIVGTRLVEPILVAHLDVGQFERRRMASLRPQRSPFGRGRTHHVLDLVERVLHVWFEIRSRIHVRPLERIARVDRQQGLGVHVLAPEQEFVEAEPVGRAITPRRHVAGAFWQRPNRLLPLEPVGDLIPLEVVASGETQELRLHVDHHLHDVRTESVRLILERRREQRHQAEPDRAGTIDGQDVACLRGGCHLVGL